jgi:hypothetical protein
VLLQRRDDEPRNPQARVDLQAKTMAASECDEEVRAAWRERVAGNRPQAARVRGRVRLERRTCAAARQGTQGGAGPRQEHTTLLASMGFSGMGPCLAMEGGATRAVFEFYVERGPAPLIVAVETRTLLAPRRDRSALRG